MGRFIGTSRTGMVTKPPSGILNLVTLFLHTILPQTRRLIGNVTNSLMVIKVNVFLNNPLTYYKMGIYYTHAEIRYGRYYNYLKTLTLNIIIF